MEGAGGGRSRRQEEGDTVTTGGEPAGKLGGREDVAGVVEGDDDDLAIGHLYLTWEQDGGSGKELYRRKKTLPLRKQGGKQA